MSHDSTFPDSAEAPDKRTDRALEALNYENSAGLGFRRRERKALGNPYEGAEAYQVGSEPTTGELWAGLLAGIAAVLAFGAIFYKPLLLGSLAVVFVVFGSLGDERAAKLARGAFVMTLVGVTIGMAMCIWVTDKAIW